MIETHWALIASILALFAGPCVLGLWGKNPRLASGFHWLAVAGIGLLVVAFVLPECVREAGLWAAGSLLLGLGFPVATERVLRSRSTSLAPWLLLLPLVAHALLDGFALSVGTQHAHLGSEHAGHGLVAALVLHRLPEGIAIWYLGSAHGKRTALTALLLDAVCCTLGFSVLPLPTADPAVLALLEAFVGGVLLHVLLEGPRAVHRH